MSPIFTWAAFFCLFYSHVHYVLCSEKTNSDLFKNKLEENEAFELKESLNFSAEVKFYLYTRKNPLDYEQILLDNLYYSKWTHFDAKKSIKVLVHGWKSTYRSAYNILLKNAYLTQYDTNVIIADWSKYSKLWYFPARHVVNNVAEVIADMIDQLCDYYNINADNIHIVGHSLGAHVAGIAGLKTKKKVARVTGLDPAGPDFSIKDKQRISTESAKFVDIMHTDGGSAGFFHPLGHVDFYPNGGTAIQPGCGLDILTLRSHRRAYWLFAESITTPDGFSAVQCDSWSDYKNQKCEGGNRTFMGEHVSPNARGKYFLRTNSRTPFALETLKITSGYEYLY
ncbi:hypothetical protein O3M35_007263 [Rhynocoris fuscipes]|uniref:Lipase domain-containing protein n=1 Tax=Rhynocoris fuscipes TaxID=488301 RepID=A0AAW1DCE1_9HEMI